MALELLDNAAGQDKWTEAYAKLNAAITAINELSAGSAGQSIRKTDGTDFNYEFFTPYELPSQTGNEGKAFVSDGTNATWQNAGIGSGTFDASHITFTGGTATINSTVLKWIISGGVVHLSFGITYTRLTGFPATQLNVNTLAFPIAIRPSSTSDAWWGSAIITLQSDYPFGVVIILGGMIIALADTAAHIPTGSNVFVSGHVTYPL